MQPNKIDLIANRTNHQIFTRKKTQKNEVNFYQHLTSKKSDKFHIVAFHLTYRVRRDHSEMFDHLIFVLQM